MRPTTVSCLLLSLCTPALAAAPEPVPLTYATFEAAVPHIDLYQCPETLDRENVFCRATLAHEEIHVFVFSDQGDSPLVGFGSFDAGALPQLLN